MRQLFTVICLGGAMLTGVGCGRRASSSELTHRSGEFRVLLPARPSTLNPNLNLDESALSHSLVLRSER
jgi:hypothetical protein